MKKRQSTFANVSERDKKLLLLLFSLIFLAISYFFVFVPNNTKVSEIEEKNKQLDVRLQKLKVMKESEAEKIQEIEEFTNKRKAILVKFPDKVTQEKAITELVDIEKEGEMDAATVGFNLNEEFYNSKESDTTDTVQAEANTSETQSDDGIANTYTEATPLAAYKTTMTINYNNTSLEGFQKIVEKVNKSKNKMAIESVTASFDAESGNLMGTMNLCLFSVDNSETKYEEPVISNMLIGMKSIFGTLEIKKAK